MSKELDEITKKMARLITRKFMLITPMDMAKQILKLETATCRIAVVRKDSKLPTKSDARLYGSEDLSYETGYIDGFNRCRNEVKAGFVQEVKE